MSYTTSIKNEIAFLEKFKSETIAELSGFIRNNGYIDDNKLFLTTENKKIMENIVSTIKKLYEIKVEVETKRNLNFSKNDLYLIIINERIDFILKDLGFYNNDLEYLDTPPEYIVGANEEIRSYLRGVFLSQGSINDPKTSRYHM